MFSKILKNNYPIVLTLLLFVLFALVGKDLTLFFRYDRSEILNGEIYRLLTAHFVHLNGVHAAMNSVAAVIGWYLFKNTMSRRQWLLSITGTAIFISLLLLTVRDLAWYVGFSGIIHGLMLQGLILDRKMGWPVRAAMISGLLLKVAYEQWQGADASTVELIGGNVVLEGHLFGLVAGMTMAGVIIGWNHRSK